jgi:hypothetical protein
MSEVTIVVTVKRKMPQTIWTACSMMAMFPLVMTTRLFKSIAAEACDQPYAEACKVWTQR